MTDSEADFLRWMEELDLEAVNLLGPGPASPQGEDRYEGRLQAPAPTPPPPPPARGVGWDEPD